MSFRNALLCVLPLAIGGCGPSEGIVYEGVLTIQTDKDPPPGKTWRTILEKRTKFRLRLNTHAGWTQLSEVDGACLFSGEPLSQEKGGKPWDRYVQAPFGTFTCEEDVPGRGRLTLSGTGDKAGHLKVWADSADVSAASVSRGEIFGVSFDGKPK
jgi:hypothetical protein